MQNVTRLALWFISYPQLKLTRRPIYSQWRSQWPRGLRRRSAAARLLRSWVRISTGAWKFVCCECCVLSGRGLCDDLIPRPEESYRLWCVVVCDLEISRMRMPWPALDRSATAVTTALLRAKRWYSSLNRISDPQMSKSIQPQRIAFVSVLLTLRWLMSYIYGAPILDVSRSHTTTQHSR